MTTPKTIKTINFMLYSICATLLGVALGLVIYARV
jgi:hypothetical protein